MRSESYGTKNKYPVSVGYCHLLVNNPVAVNPRTGEPFKPGDVVYQGEIISYPHLHLVVKKNSNFVDPEPYINGKLNTTGQDENKLVSSTEVNNIKSVIK